MKRHMWKAIKIALVFLALLFIGFLVYLDHTSGESIQPATQITLAVRTIYNDGNLAAPDSVRVHVLYNGAELTDGWYNSGDAEAAAIDDWLVFTDQLQDIDGAGGAGHYVILARAYDADSTLYTPFIYTFEVGLMDTVYGVMDTLQLQDNWVASETNVDANETKIDLVQAEVDNIDAWNPITDNDSLIIDQSTIEDIAINLDNATGTLSDAQIDNITVESVTGAVGSIGSGGITAVSIGTGAIGADELATDGIQEIGAGVWMDIDTTNTIDTSDIGDWFINNISGGSLTAITDTVNAILDTLQNQDNEGDSIKHIYMTPGGSGANNGLTWQTAVCSLRTAESLCTGANSYVIHIAPGTYSAQICTVNIVEPLEIDGAGMFQTILTNATAGQWIIYVNTTGSGLKINNLQFQANFTGGYPIYVNDCDNYEISNCYFNSSLFGIYLNANAQQGWIHNCVFYANNTDHIYFNGADLTIIEDCIFDSLVSANANAIWVGTNSNHNKFFRNYLYVTNGLGITLDGAYGTFMAGNYAWAKGDSTAFGEIAWPRVGDARSGYTAFVGNWGRNESDVDSFWSVQAEQKYLFDPATDEVDVGSISGDSVAANNLEYAYTDTNSSGVPLLRLGALHIRADATDDDTAIIAIGGGVGHGAYIEGGADGNGLYAKGGSTGGYGLYGHGTAAFAGILGQGGASNAPGIYGYGGATNGHGMYVEGVGTGSGFKANGGTGVGHGMQLVSGQGGGASYGLYVWSTDGHGAVFERSGAGNYDINLAGDGTIHGTLDSVVGVARVDSVRVTDTLNTAVDAVSCAGTGSNTITLLVLSATDSSGMYDVKIDIEDSATGSWRGAGHTNASGVKAFSLDDGTYTIHYADPPNSITTPAYLTVSGNVTDTVFATVFAPGSPPSADYCRLWALISELDADWSEGCRMSVSIPSRYYPVILTDDSSTVVNPYTVSGVSNDTGYVYVDVYESNEMYSGSGDTVKVKIKITNPHGAFIAQKLLYVVPDSVSHKIIF